MSIFKAYDIRGIVGPELNEQTAHAIGRGFATLVKPQTVVLGRDMRPHSLPLTQALTDGLLRQGVNVVDLGLVSTPMCYFANGSLGADAGIMVTASHNPGAYNGFKLCRAQAIPISGATGIRELEAIVREQRFDPPAATPGTRSEMDIFTAYAERIRSFSRLEKPLHVAIDFANAMGIREAEALRGLLTWDALYDEYDGSFPHHEANPLDAETFTDLSALVRSGSYAFGLAFDGDADRVGFVDEHGEIVTMDMITAIIAQAMLQEEKGTVFYDLRSSWAVKETIEEAGGTPAMSRVGHAFIKQQIRDANALFAGELSGHYYFRENFFTESSALAALMIANRIQQTGKTLSELVKPIRRYHASGEINSEVKHPEQVFEVLKKRFAGARTFELDGLSVEFDDWWFNVRMSNTEPLCRLNLEARSQTEMEMHRDEILALIRRC